MYLAVRSSDEVILELVEKIFLSFVGGYLIETLGSGRKTLEYHKRQH